MQDSQKDCDKLDRRAENAIFLRDEFSQYKIQDKDKHDMTLTGGSVGSFDVLPAVIA